MEITGKTKLTGIIGNPVEHSLSPAIQNSAFESSKMDWIYVPLPVLDRQIPIAMQAVKSFFKGINVTMPYKQDVIPFMDEVSSYAKLVGAVNTIKVEEERLVGFNTDGRGFLHALEQELKFSAEDKKIALIGAGGAARSIATILALSKMKKIIIINRNSEKAENLGESIVKNFKDIDVDILSLNENLPKSISECDLIINATPVGMQNDEIPIDMSFVKKGQFVVDIIYQRETEFLKKSKKLGAKTMSGKSMLIYQGAASFEIWTQRSAPVEIMKKALEEILKNEKN